jgi:hypothetical protein
VIVRALFYDNGAPEGRAAVAQRGPLLEEGHELLVAVEGSS